MRVSVIIPTYNRAYILLEAIESVLCQTFSDFGLIVVDDGSTDETGRVVERIQDARVRFIRHPKNLGTSAAKNTGVAQSEGEFIAFLDSDDLWKPEKLESQVKFLDEHPEAAGVFSDLEWLSGTKQVSSMLSVYQLFAQLRRNNLRDNQCVFLQRALYVCLLEEMPVKLQASMLRRDSVRKIGKFEESWRSGEDWEFFLRFARQNAMGYIDRALTVQRTLDDSTLAQHRKADAASLMERFIQEKQQLHGDQAALAAVRRGIANQAKELGAQYMRAGDRLNAAKAYWRGFTQSQSWKLLARLVGVALPLGAWRAARHLQGASTQ